MVWDSHATVVFQSSLSSEMAADLESEDNLHILTLPEEILDKILSSLSYQEISEVRLSCQGFNRSCQQILNQGFAKVDKFHAFVQKQIKGKLPRRESERRNHHLARHVDILSAIETRLSLLGMTYMKYMDMGLCCFIPGKVLDELFRILLTLQQACQPPRAHEFLQELRDISSMAMEHFEEKIVPILKQKMPSMSLTCTLGNLCVSTDNEPGTSTTVLPLSTTTTNIRGSSAKQEILRIQNQLRAQGSTIHIFKKEMADYRSRLLEQKKKSLEQEKKSREQCKKIQEQGKTISDQNIRLTEQERKVNELSRKVLEYEHKLADIFSELSRIRGEGGDPSVSHSLGTQVTKGAVCSDKPDMRMVEKKDPGVKSRKVLKRKIESKETEELTEDSFLKRQKQ